jgi:formyl-CoA transferase
MVSTSLLANGLWMNATSVQAMLLGSRFPLRPAREKASNALTNTFRCRDDRWIMLAVLAEDRDWDRFTAAMGGGDLSTDPRFATTTSRRANAPTLTARLDAIFARKDLAEWRRILDAHGIIFGVVGTLDDIPHDRQMTDIGALVPFADGACAGALTVSSPLSIDGQSKMPARRAPDLGEHTVEVLREAGLDEDHIGRLVKDGVVAVPAP